jgi:hypothetical protein
MLFANARGIRAARRYLPRHRPRALTSPCVRPLCREETSPTLAPDSSTQMTFTDYSEDFDFRTSQSELLGALGDLPQPHSGLYFNMQAHFPGPYHPDYSSHMYTIPSQGSDPPLET